MRCTPRASRRGRSGAGCAGSSCSSWWWSLLGAGLYPLDRGQFGIAGVALALAVLVAGTALTALARAAAQPGGRPAVRVVLRRRGAARPRQPGPRPAAHRPHGRCPDHRAQRGRHPGRGGGERPRHGGPLGRRRSCPAAMPSASPLPVDIEQFRPDFESTAGAAAASPIAEFPLVIQRRRHAARGVDGGHRPERVRGHAAR